MQCVLNTHDVITTGYCGSLYLLDWDVVRGFPMYFRMGFLFLSSPSFFSFVLVSCSKKTRQKVPSNNPESCKLWTPIIFMCKWTQLDYFKLRYKNVKLTKKLFNNFFLIYCGEKWKLLKFLIRKYIILIDSNTRI